MSDIFIYSVSLVTYVRERSSLSGSSPLLLLRSTLVDDSVGAVLRVRLWVLPVGALVHHHLLLGLLGLLSNDLPRQELLLVWLARVVRHLAVADTAHHARVVESLWAVVRVPEVLLEVRWRLVVAVGSVVELHLSTLVGNASSGLQDNLDYCPAQTFRPAYIEHGLCLCLGVPLVSGSVGPSQRTCAWCGGHRLEVLTGSCCCRLGLLPHPEQVECGVWRNVLLLAWHGVTR